jgi:hypothetical protein
MVVLLVAELALRLVLARGLGRRWVLGLKKVTDLDLGRLKASGLVKETAKGLEMDLGRVKGMVMGWERDLVLVLNP